MLDRNALVVCAGLYASGSNAVEHESRAIHGIFNGRSHTHAQGSAFFRYDRVAELRHDAASLLVQIEEHQLFGSYLPGRFIDTKNHERSADSAAANECDLTTRMHLHRYS